MSYFQMILFPFQLADIILDMSSEKFNLAWNDFEASASRTFKSLLDDHDFTNVTLASHDNEQIKAHKVILSSSSQFFKRIIMKNPHQNPLLYLRNVNFKELQHIINFIYLGQTEVEQSELEHFLEIAKDLEISGLTENCTDPEKCYEEPA